MKPPHAFSLQIVDGDGDDIFSFPRDDMNVLDVDG